jgi:hypothetical protein
MSSDPINPCRVLLDRYKNLARWRNVWTILLFVFGATMIFFFCAAIAYYRGGDWLTVSGSAIATLASGTGVGWVVARRGEAIEEETAALNDYIERCAGGGTKGTSAGPADVRSILEIPPEILAYQRKLRLIGPIR